MFRRSRDRRLSFENLELRTVLSGSPLGLDLHALRAAVPADADVLAHADVASKASADASASSHSRDAFFACLGAAASAEHSASAKIATAVEANAPGNVKASSPVLRGTTVLVAHLTDPADADFEARVKFSANAALGFQVLSAQVHGAAADESLDVMIDGVLVGTIKTNAAGSGRLRLYDGSIGDSPSFPDGMTIAAGATVEIGTAVGTLEPAITLLTASLADPVDADMETKVRLLSKTNGEVTKQSLFVRVTGAAALESLDVMIDGVLVGTITTNAEGNGKLRLSTSGRGPFGELPAGLPAIEAGATIEIGATLSGVLA